MRIIAIEVVNLATKGIMSGSITPKGSIGITVDKLEFGNYTWVTANDIDLDDSYFDFLSKNEKYSIRNGSFKALFAQDGDVLHIYGYLKNSSDGFANRKIKLRINEPSIMFPKIQAIRQHEFEGCLWESYVADRMVAKFLNTSIKGIGLKEARDRYGYSSVKATQNLINKIAKVIVLGEPIQGDFNA